jgi:hypothetical protein
MRTPALTALLVALALTAVPASAAEAATTRSICARTAVVYDSPPPYGFVIARLQGSQRHRLRVQGYNPTRRWALVVTRDGTAGWVSARSLCRA